MVIEPYNRFAAVSPSDTVDFAEGQRPAALWVGGLGDLIVAMGDNTRVTFSAVAAGTLLPITARRVHSTGTTATLIIALYRS